MSRGGRLHQWDIHFCQMVTQFLNPHPCFLFLLRVMNEKYQWNDKYDIFRTLLVIYLGNVKFTKMVVFLPDWFSQWGGVQAREELGETIHQEGAGVLRLAFPHRPMEETGRYMPLPPRES